MADLCREYQLNYEIQASKLIHRVSGTEITFRGFRQQGAFNIQGMEGIDIVWIDEAQALTKQTIDVLIPTIRKKNSKVFFTMNRHVVDDPAYKHCIDSEEECLHIHINYLDNEYCTDILKNEAAKCLAKRPEDYGHIWLGEPLAMAENAVFSKPVLLNTVHNRHPFNSNYGLRIGGFDIARYGDDKSACVVIQQMGALHWETFHVEQWGKQDLNFTTGKIFDLYGNLELSKCIIDEDGIGGGPLDTLNKGRRLEAFVGFRNPPLSYKDNKDYANNRTANAYKVLEMVNNGQLVITQPELIDELCTIRYSFDHSQRKILVSKEQMRKDKIKSPNLADALIMAVSLIGEIKYEQENQYRPSFSQQAPDCDLYDVAGIM